MSYREHEQWAASHQTNEQIVEQIFSLARGDEAEAQRIWEDPTVEEWLAIWERVTGNGLRDGDDYNWGAGVLGNAYAGG